ncbi:unnamed protein product [Musa acuminata subsp. malaccensis]|uniref:(wild Malaysian banana) hypothetical protein n=1 Tax=Musa acuminata subsp. malaccensis TaxID=214687 RepID=A0A804K6P5_MUSAM|nr:unnamed protein product [Musa acuminata subsp. malaccensis]
MGQKESLEIVTGEYDQYPFTASYWCCLRDRLHGFGPFPEPQGHTLTTDSFSMSPKST